MRIGRHSASPPLCRRAVVAATAPAGACLRRGGRGTRAGRGARACTTGRQKLSLFIVEERVNTGAPLWSLPLLRLSVVTPAKPLQAQPLIAKPTSCLRLTFSALHTSRRSRRSCDAYI